MHYHNRLKVYTDISEFRASNPFVTIGIFDGVHLGHVAILKRLQQLAADSGGESVVVTLWPHPRMILEPAYMKGRLLTTLEEKISMIENHGIDKLIILPFTAGFSLLSFQSFIRDYLFEMIGTKHLVVGFNHHFGSGREGTYDNLKKTAALYGITTERMEAVMINGNRVSSSAIRHMVEDGNVAVAREALGYWYNLSGTVIAGDRIGRTLGYPTANVRPNDEQKLIPASGVYAVIVRVKNRDYKGMLSIGTRPTVRRESQDRSIEVNIFDFEEDIYGMSVQISFIDWLRPELAFISMAGLREQLGKDREKVNRLLEAL